MADELYELMRSAPSTRYFTDETIDLIAERAGFGNAATLRHHFRAWRGITPQAYRRTFRDPAAPLTPATA